jgi:hypothetical protein
MGRRRCLWTLLFCFGLLLIAFGVLFVEYFQEKMTSENIEGRGPVPVAIRTYPFRDTGVVLIVLGVVTTAAGYLKSIGRMILRRSKEAEQNPP